MLLLQPIFKRARILQAESKTFNLNFTFLDPCRNFSVSAENPAAKNALAAHSL